MDYQELLKKYMRVVVREEGVSFVRYANSPEFSPEEQRELQRMAQEAGG